MTPCMNNNSKLQRVKLVFSDTWQLIKPYFNSQEKHRARILIAAIVMLTIASVYVTRLIAEWNGVFSTARQQRQADAFWSALLQFPLLAIAFIVIAVYGFYLAELLELRWRKWMTENYLSRWLSYKAFYRLELQRFDKDVTTPDNPDQRIQEDVAQFTTQTVTLFKGLVNSILTLVLFLGLLWSLGDGTDIRLPAFLGGGEYDIPGFLVWIAFLYCGTASWITFKLGRPQQTLNYQKQMQEANFRHHLIRVRENAEAIALDRGEAVEQSQLRTRFYRLFDTSFALIQNQKKLLWFTSFYAVAAMVFTDVLLGPRYLRGDIEAGVLATAAISFGAVQSALSWLIDNYPDLAAWRATSIRLMGFNKVIAQPPEHLQHAFVADKDKLDATLTSITLPEGKTIVANEELHVNRGDLILLEGASGSGKSTMLRALAGIWPYAEGRVELPQDIMFIPQKPYFPEGSLRNALAYPSPPDTYTEVQLHAALLAVNLPAQVDQLDFEQAWNVVLSGGEKQRLAIARVLLKRPTWIIADEVSSALDIPTETLIYTKLVALVKENHGALISIAHRDTVRQFHDISWVLDPKTQKIITSRMIK